MEQLQVGLWRVRCDPDATRAAYAKIIQGGAEACGCTACQNFASVRETVYPTAFRALLEQLGVDYRRESEVYTYGVTHGEGHHYEGWFHFVRQIVQGRSPWSPIGEHLHMLTAWQDLNEDFAFWCHADPAAVPAVFGDQHLVQLEFRHTAVPWVLDAPPPSWQPAGGESPCPPAPSS